MVFSGERNDIQSFIEEVLMNRFPGEKLKQEVVPGDRSFNFSCPYCGDSTKDPRNHRGNLYLKTKTFKCFNDGCFKFATLRDFVSQWSQTYDIDITDLNFDFDVEFKPYESKIDLGGNTISDYMRRNGLLDQLMNINDMKYRFGLIKIDESLPGTKAHDFFLSRNLNSIPNVGDYIFYDGMDKGVYIFNYDKRSGKVLAFSIRTLLPDKLKKKYDMFTYSRIMEKLNITTEIKDITILDTFGNFFNIMNVDFKKPIALLEGQIDSLFIDNSIAATGLSKFHFLMEFIDKNSIRMLFDNDKAGKKMALQYLGDGYNTFLWSLLMNKMDRKFTKDAKLLKKIKDINNLFTFLNSRGLNDLDKFNTLINRYYSNSPCDMLYV